MASLIAAGVKPDVVETVVAFSCEGRFSRAGPWPSSKDQSAKAGARRKVRGCDWTLGGMFQLHELEITFPDSTEPRPTFVIATPEQARELEREMTSRPQAEPKPNDPWEASDG
jgi:hypothetical protein